MTHSPGPSLSSYNEGRCARCRRPYYLEHFGDRGLCCICEARLKAAAKATEEVQT